jgi:hypothetical protein
MLVKTWLLIRILHIVSGLKHSDVSCESVSVMKYKCLLGEISATGPRLYQK